MSFVTVQKEAGLAVVSMERGPVNALNVDLLNEIYDATVSVAGDREVRAVLFRSNLPGVFIAGADLNSFKDSETSRTAIHAFRRCFDGIENLAKPTVAAIAGHALGGGCELTLACDFRLMIDDERATIGLPETGLGLFPGAGGTQRLPRIVGQARALDIILHARRLTGPEALEAKLVHQLVAADTFEQDVRQYALKLAAGPTKAYAAAKALVQTAFDRPLADGLEAESDAFLRILDSKDAQAGVAAFLAKERPDFTGE